MKKLTDGRRTPSDGNTSHVGPGERSACQDLHALQFLSKSDYPSRSYCPFFYHYLAHLAQHVRYCHHLASVVRPLTFSYFNWSNGTK
jgi:hypothetical protein